MCFVCSHCRVRRLCARCSATRNHAIAQSNAAFSNKSCEEMVPGNRLLLFVNPSSGTGKSVRLFSEKVLPRLVSHGLDHDLVITESSDHAKSIVLTSEKLFQYNAIVILSGDGLVFEIINGLLERRDGESCLRRLPIGIIPAGSGNGLLASVFHDRQIPLRKNDFLSRAIEHICDVKACAYPVNLMHVETSLRSYAAFLSIGFGLIADLDIESERWRRMLGSARFVAGAWARLCNLRAYHCILRFLPSTESESTSMNSHPMKVYSKSEILEEENGVETSDIACADGIENIGATLRRHHVREKIPAVDEPAPPEWTVIDDDFILIYAVATSHISRSSYFMPRAQLNDPSIYLSYVLKKDLNSKWSLMKFLGDIDSGKHIDHPFFHVVPVSAFRLEAVAKPKHYGNMTVDGEVVDCDVLQATATTLTTSVIADH